MYKALITPKALMLAETTPIQYTKDGWGRFIDGEWYVILKGGWFIKYWAVATCIFADCAAPMGGHTEWNTVSPTFYSEWDAVKWLSRLKEKP